MQLVKSCVQASLLLLLGSLALALRPYARGHKWKLPLRLGLLVLALACVAINLAAGLVQVRQAFVYACVCSE
jgi:hypothetical protein